MKQNDLIEIMQYRLDDCVVRERYEMAAKLRDLIIYETTDNEEYKHQYYLKLPKKYTKEEIRKMIEEKGGSVGGDIHF